LGTRDYISERLSLMFIDVPPQRILFGQILISLVPALLVFLYFIPRWLPAGVLAATFAIAGWYVPRPLVDYFYRRRVNRFVLQMVDGLGLMSNGLRSGLSIVQSLGLVTQELPSPIKEEFGLILNQNKLGVPLEECFTNLSKRVIADDVEMFVTGVNILKETGGNLAETFDTIVTTIRERIRVEDKIKTLTAQGFYQGVIVMSVPPLMGTIFYLTDPDFMRPLWETPIGWAILFGVVGLEVLGMFLILKFIKIDV